MSWQAYADNLVASGHIDKAALFGPQGDSVWAVKTADGSQWDIQPDELRTLVDIINKKPLGTEVDGSPLKPGQQDPTVLGKAQSDGVYVGGERYVVLKTEEQTDGSPDFRSIYMRKDKQGLILVNAKFAMLLGHQGADQLLGNTAQTLEAMGDYLQKSMGQA